MDASLPLLAVVFLLGAALGSLAVWLLRLRPLELALAEARLRTETAEARAAAAESAHAELRGQADGLQERLRTLEAEKRGLEERLSAERRAHEARLDELRQAAVALEEKFADLASRVLDRNSRQFLRLVSERFEQHRREAVQDLETRQRAIAELLRPLRESLERFENRVGELEKAREGAYRAIEQQVRMLAEGQEKLRIETGRLVQALRRPQVRGRWGELQLRNVVELAGMSEHVDFTTQTSVEGADGRLRPDAVVRLPGGKTVVVDVKTPLEAYLRAVEAEDEETRRRELQQHARQLRAHVTQLASKEYWNQFREAPDFVVLFVPGEAFYAAAVEADPTLFEDALRRRVLLTSPATFVALMKAIAYGWQQEKIAESAARIAETARELHQRIRTFLGHVERLGKALGSAVDHYNRAVGSLESRVLPQARRFETLGATPADRPLPEMRPVELAPRALAAAEGAAADGDADGPTR